MSVYMRNDLSSTNQISTRQAVCILVMYIFGNSLMYSGSKVKQDTWLAVLIGLFMFVPMMLIYARTVSLYPGKNLFDIIDDIFGKIFGRIIALLYVFYAIHLGALLMRNFSEFIQVASMPETPQLIVLVFLFALGIWMVKSGLVVLGRWAKFALPVVLIAVMVTILISMNSINFNNIRPVASTAFPKLMDSSFTLFSFPYGETILFLALFGAIETKKGPYKIFFWGILISLIFMLMAILRNIFVLGFPSLEMYYFASYTTVSVISLGDFFTRIEVLIGLAFLLDLFVKQCVCMFAASIGVSKIFNIKNYKNLAIPTGLFMLTLASILYPNTLEMYKWIDVYKYYALPFQVVLPLMIFIGAEIKTRIKKKAISNSAGNTAAKAQ